MSDSNSKPRVCAVSYLNTVQLVWGMLHSHQYQEVDLTFHVPSVCADMLKTGLADVALLSSIELPRQKLDYVRGLGIASRGAVRSIFLVSKKPLSSIRSLSADISSRTSIALCHIVLSRRFHVDPEFISAVPDLSAMLESTDAALIIGDPALHLNPDNLPYTVYDLGQEWTELTGLPMVYAVWAAPKDKITEHIRKTFRDSYLFGRDHLDDIVKIEAPLRGFPESLARQYLTHNIIHELGSEEYKGMDLFLQYAAELNLI